MPDHGHSVIVIGGDLDEQQSAQLVDHLEVTPYTRLERGNGVLEITEPDARGGKFPELESLCQEQGIPFNRYTDHSSYWPADHAFYRPGMEDPVSFPAISDNSDHRAVMVETIQNVLSTDHDSMEDLEDSLRSVIGNDIEDLPELSLTLSSGVDFDDLGDYVDPDQDEQLDRASPPVSPEL